MTVMRTRRLHPTCLPQLVDGPGVTDRQAAGGAAFAQITRLSISHGTEHRMARDAYVRRVGAAGSRAISLAKSGCGFTPATRPRHARETQHLALQIQAPGFPQDHTSMQGAGEQPNRARLTPAPGPWDPMRNRRTILCLTAGRVSLQCRPQNCHA